MRAVPVLTFSLTHSRALIYLLLGPLAGLTLFLIALLLTFTGSQSTSNWLAIPGYVGLCAATMRAPHWCDIRTIVTCSLLVMGIAGTAPTLGWLLLMLFFPPVSLFLLCTTALFLAPVGIALHYLWATVRSASALPPHSFLHGNDEADAP